MASNLKDGRPAVLALEAEQTRWQRKETIARNKLIDVRRKLSALAHEMARSTVETEWTGGAKS